MSNYFENKKKVLEVNELKISFKTNQGILKAVRDVNFDLYEGETFAIVGESGSGKSVSSRAITGILAGNAIIESGQILYENQDLTKIHEEDFHKIRGHKIGMIFQDPTSSLNPIMRIGKQITESMLVNGNRLKNRYRDLFHYEHTMYRNAVIDRRNFKAQIKRVNNAHLFNKLFEHVDLEIQPVVNRIIEINNLENSKDFAAEKKELIEKFVNYNKKLLVVNKNTIKETKAQLVEKRKEAKQIVKQEWRDEKAKYAALIDEQKALLESNKEDKEKVKEIRTEINRLREELARYRKVTKKEAFERAVAIMREVGIPQPEKRFRQYPFQFSGGMKQRIVIAIALTADPDILICDEPTTALDVTIQAQILDLIKEIKERRNLTVIFITHDLGVVANVADRVAVMYAGKIVEIGTVDEIFYNPKHPYTWALLSSMPDLDSVGRLSSIPGTPPNMLFPPKGDAFAERNEYALKIDFEKEPPYFKVSETHYAATWLLHKDAPKVELPKIIQERIERRQQDSEEA